MSRYGELARQPLARAFADGVADGMAITLRLLLGEPALGGRPYTGHRPEELVVWAEAALERLRAAGVDEARRG